MRNRLPVLAAVGAVVIALGIGTVDRAPRTADERVQHLSEVLRCPVCDGLSVADSPSSTARAIADDIRTMVAEGRSDDEIVDVYVARYGTWILLEPPTGGVGSLAWMLPIAFVAAALAVVVLTLQRRFSTVESALGDSDRKRVEQARKTFMAGEEVDLS